MKLYTTRVDCEVGGQWRVAGVPFTLTDAQAAELTPPRGSVVALYVPPAPTPAPEESPADKEPVNGRLNRRQRRNRKTAE